MPNSSAIYFQTKFFSPPLQPWILKQIPKQTEPMMSRGQTNPWQISTKRPNPWDRHYWKKRVGEKTNKLKHLFKTSKIATLTTLFLSWLAGWLVCDKSKLCAFSLSLSPSQHSQHHHIHAACRNRRNPVAVSSPSTQEHFRASRDSRSPILPRSRRSEDPDNVDFRFLPPGGSSFFSRDS